MAMDIRPNPLGDSPQPQAPPPGMPNEQKTRMVVFGVIVLVALLLVGGWFVLGAPGAPTSIKKSLGKLPLSGNRDISQQGGDNGNGLSFNEQQQQQQNQGESPLSGVQCGHPTRRPLGVMVASDPINRPDSGFSSADLVFEMPVLTNNVTRLMAVFQCNEPKEIGSVRSARHDYLFLAKGIDAVTVHWGGSYWALNMIKVQRDIYNSINALGIGQEAFYRKAGKPAPYNGFTSYARAWDALQRAGYRTYTVFKGYKHEDDAAPDQRGSGGTLDIGWPGVMRVRYIYNPQNNDYERYWGGVRTVDPENNQPVNPKVVVVVHTTQKLADGPGGYNDVAVEGQGKAEVYENGQVIEGTWKKDIIKKEDPQHFLDANGNDIPLVRGQVWISIVDQVTPTRWTPGTTAPAELNNGTTPANLGG